MDIHRLDQAVQEYYTAALTSATHKTYKAAEQKYLTFCANFSLPPITTSENILCYFAACLGQEGLASSTIRNYLSGVCQIQIAAGFPDPLIDHMPQLRQVLKGIRVQTPRIEDTQNWKTAPSTSSYYSLYPSQAPESMARR